MTGMLADAQNKYNFFRSCYVGENKYCIGDFVLVKKLNESIDDARVLRIEACCDRGSKYGSARIVVFATRFLRKGDVPRLQQDMRELVMDTSKQGGSEMVSASDIQYACQVEAKNKLKHSDSTSFYYFAGYDGKKKSALSAKQQAAVFQFRSKAQLSDNSENQSPIRHSTMMPAVSTPGTTKPRPFTDRTFTGNDTDSQSDDLDDIFSETLRSKISTRRAAKGNSPLATERTAQSKQPTTRARRLGNNSKSQSTDSKLRATSSTSSNSRREKARNMIESVDYGGGDIQKATNTDGNPYDFTSDDQLSPPGKPPLSRKAGLRNVAANDVQGTPGSNAPPTKRSRTSKKVEKVTKNQQETLARKEMGSKRRAMSTSQASGLDVEGSKVVPKRVGRKEGAKAIEQGDRKGGSRLLPTEDVTEDVCVQSSTRSLRQRTAGSRVQKELREDDSKSSSVDNNDTDGRRRVKSTRREATSREEEVRNVIRSAESQTRADIIRSKLRRVVKEQNMSAEEVVKEKTATKGAVEKAVAGVEDNGGASRVRASNRSVRQRNTAAKSDRTEEVSENGVEIHSTSKQSRRYEVDTQIAGADSDPEISHAKSPPTRSRSSRRSLRNIKTVNYCTDHKDDSDDDESFHSGTDEGDNSSDEGSDSHEPRKWRRKSTAYGRRNDGKTSINRRSLAACTPSVPNRLQPVVEGATALERARAQLHVSVVPDSLPCRDEEFANILGYVESKLEGGSGGCLYISGVPGTGKTATVFEVIRYLEQSMSCGQLPSFKFISINGMRLTQPHQAFVHIYKRLTGKKVTADHATSLLDAIFCKARRQESIVLLVDELDLLMTRKQDVLYNLFDWPTKPRSKLIVLAIANTMDLPERVMMNRVSSRLGLNRMTFQPYTFQQLQEIVHSRLSGVAAFDPDAVQLASRKVAAVSGDARRALDICRRSTEVAENSGAKMVTMQHVNEALQEMFSSPKITAIRSCSYYEKIILKAIVAEFTRSGLEEATLYQVFRHVDAICAMDRMPAIKLVQMMKVCSNLNNIRLVLLECNGKGIYQRVRLNVGQDDVQYALREDKS